jgi:hypothetical protein
MPLIVDRHRAGEELTDIINSIPQRNILAELERDNFAGLCHIARYGKSEDLRRMLAIMNKSDPIRNRLNKVPLLRQVVNFLTPRVLSRALRAGDRHRGYILYLEALQNDDNMDSVKEVLVAARKSRMLFEIVRANALQALDYAAAKGRLDIIDMVWERAGRELRDEIIEHHNYEMIRTAAQNGHLDIAKRFLEVASPAQRSAMIKADSYFAFRMSAMGGHLTTFNEMLQYLNPAEIDEMLGIFHHDIFALTAVPGHLAMFNRLVELSSQARLNTMLTSNSYGVFSSAVFSGNVALVNRIVELSQAQEIPLMLAVRSFNPFVIAARKGCVDMFNRLLEVASTTGQLQAMIVANDNFNRPYMPFREAAQNNSFATLNRLLELSDQAQQQLMIASLPRGTSAEVNLIINLPALLTANPPAEYRDSLINFTREMMRQVYVNAINKFVPDTAIPAINPNLSDHEKAGLKQQALTLEQRYLVESNVRRMGAYILLNREKFRDLKDVAIEFGKKARDPSQVFMPPELDAEIVRHLGLPRFPHPKRGDFLQFGNSETFDRNNVALFSTVGDVLRNHALTLESAIDKYRDKPQVSTPAISAPRVEPLQAGQTAANSGGVSRRYAMV